MKDSYSEHRRPRNDPRYQFRGQPIISDQISLEGLEVVCRHLEEILEQNIPGAIVEFGCYVGTTSLFIRRIMDEHHQSQARSFHAYDSFEGLPEKGPQDRNAAGVDFQAGKLYVSKKAFLAQFRSSNLQPPRIHKGWFNKLAARDIPAPIAFAFLDGDFYESILTSLQLVWPRLSPGARILVDDYKRETLPGVERAIHDFLQDKKLPIRTEQNIAILFTSI